MLLCFGSLAMLAGAGSRVGSFVTQPKVSKGTTDVAREFGVLAVEEVSSTQGLAGTAFLVQRALEPPDQGCTSRVRREDSM